MREFPHNPIKQRIRIPESGLANPDSRIRIPESGFVSIAGIRIFMGQTAALQVGPSGWPSAAENNSTRQLNPEGA